MNNSSKDRELSITRLLNAPVEKVWRAWTEAEHIAKWWGPNGFTNTISKMEVVTDGEWEFIMHGPDGTDFRNKHVYGEIIKEKKLVLNHVTAPKFQMTATFEAQGDKTLLTLHSIFESAEQLQDVIRVFKADEGMKQNMDKLEAYLENL
jgi:uncharacterized protein YndB with AHSA1/START domain